MLARRGILPDPVGMVEPAKSHSGDFPASAGFERHEVHSQEIARFAFSGSTFRRWFLCITAVAEDRSGVGRGLYFHGVLCVSNAHQVFFALLRFPSPFSGMVLREQHRDDLVQQEAYDLRVREYMNSDSEFPVAYLRGMQFIPCCKDNLHDFVNLQWMCRQEFCRNRRPSAWV